ncbi:MAG TPA: RluA family pseudouridine synthase, partial [Planctomycetota bacterium]|nr:RluA family pseudouridine synthase [Planctomycetota bacterium]
GAGVTVAPMARDLSRPRETLERRVGPDWAGRRLDDFLAAWIRWRPRDDVEARIARGDVSVDAVTADASRLLRTGEQVVLRVAPPADWKVDASIRIDVLHEEESFLVLNKAAGDVVHPVGKFVSDTLMNALFARYKRADGGLDAVPMVVHRLDRRTSGVIVFAKNDAARRRLGAAFEAREVRKEYLALTRGTIARDAFAVDLPIGPDGRGLNRTLMAVREDGRPSLTEVRTERRFAQATLVRCAPITGRTHQIRVHLAAIGHPLWCDPLYGPDGDPTQPGRVPPATAAMLGVAADDPEEIVLARLALHAARLEFPHPVTGAHLSFEAPLPPDFAGALARLGA